MLRKSLLALLLLTPLGLYPVLRETERPYIFCELPKPLTDEERLALLPLDDLVERDPVEFLQRCLTKYEKEYTGYTCIFEKRERVKGKLRQKETIRIHFSDKPFCVHMDWLKGWDTLGAVRTLYCKEENEKMLLVRVLHHEFGLKQPFALDNPQVAATSRFGIDKFGMYIGAKSTIESMRKAKEKGTLHVKYAGKMPVKEAGNQECYKLVRTPYHPPEEDNVNELIIYIDQKTLMQVGSVLKDPDGNLIAEYYFYDIKTNPSFHADQFTEKKL